MLWRTIVTGLPYIGVAVLVMLIIYVLPKEIKEWVITIVILIGMIAVILALIAFIAGLVGMWICGGLCSLG